MDGVIIINKPMGMTSHDVVAKIRKLYCTKKVGHAGTLDPDATGVLPILIGKGTKLSKYLIEHDKTYEVILKLGIKTETLDSTGKVIEERKVGKIETEEIKSVLSSFVGKQTQIPPVYSAIKIQGKKLYEYARQGKEIVVPPREIEIYKIEFLSFEEEKEISFKVNCSKGTYIRTLCEDIAIKLGTIGYMKQLVRIEVDRFKIEESITLEELEEKKQEIENVIIPIENIFYHIPNVSLTEQELEKFLNGVKLEKNRKDGIYRIYKDTNFIGIGVITNTFLKRDVII